MSARVRWGAAPLADRQRRTASSTLRRVVDQRKPRRAAPGSRRSHRLRSATSRAASQQLARITRAHAFHASCRINASRSSTRSSASRTASHQYTTALAPLPSTPWRIASHQLPDAIKPSHRRTAPTINITKSIRRDASRDNTVQHPIDARRRHLHSQPKTKTQVWEKPRDAPPKSEPSAEQGYLIAHTALPTCGSLC